MTSTLLHPLALRPIIPAWLVVILALGLLGLAAWFLIKRPREPLDWTVRALMVVAVAAILLRHGIGESGTGSLVTGMEILVVVHPTTITYAHDWHRPEHTPELANVARAGSPPPSHHSTTHTK